MDTNNVVFQYKKIAIENIALAESRAATKKSQEGKFEEAIKHATESEFFYTRLRELYV